MLRPFWHTGQGKFDGRIERITHTFAIFASGSFSPMHGKYWIARFAEAATCLTVLRSAAPACDGNQV